MSRRSSAPPAATISQTQNALFASTSRSTILKSLDDGHDLNAPNLLGETALHAQVMRNSFECAVTLLSRGAVADKKDYQGNTPLHAAIVYNARLNIVKALVVFNAHVLEQNKKGDSPLSVVEQSMPSKRRDELLMILSASFGASISQLPIVVEYRRKLREKLQSEGKMDDEEVSGEKRRPGSAGPKKKRQEKLLCLDGGGIRGMILIQLMMALEEHLSEPFVTYFDWISGTSTGGILALLLAKGYSTQECMTLYFRMKDQVFVGKRPYKPEPLEELLKEMLGEQTAMSSISKPKLLIPACMADQLPLNLHFFRNYTQPNLRRSSQPSVTPKQQPRREADDCDTQLMWHAGRATGAAPTYFRSHGGYLDGGLIANNPTLDALTEVLDYYQTLQRDAGQESPELGLVLSLGTGIPPPESVTQLDVIRPETFVELKTAPRILAGFSTLGRMIIAQATESDGRAVERSRAWCQSLNVPFFRFSPRLSAFVGLDCTDDEVLVEALYETRIFILNNWSKLKTVAELLKR